MRSFLFHNQSVQNVFSEFVKIIEAVTAKVKLIATKLTTVQQFGALLVKFHGTQNNKLV